MVSEWKCGDCGKEYAFEEFRKLMSIQLVDTDSDPSKQHGYTYVCSCGYRFHKDKWHLQNEVVFDLNWLRALTGHVSTIFLELNHFGYWYETMIFVRGKYQCHFQERYITRAEARDGHKEIIRKLIHEEFIIDKKEKEIRITDKSGSEDKNSRK